MKDPALLSDAKTQRLEISPMTGAQVQALLARLYRTPEAIVARARQALGTE